MIQTLFSADGLTTIIFLVFIATTLAGALIAVASQVLIRSVSGLALCFLGVAGIYYFLASPFLAMMQLLIYVGAICVVIIFAIMLAESDEGQRRNNPGLLAGIAASLSCAALAGGIIWLALRNGWDRVAERTNEGSVEQIGRALLTSHSMSFELISLVLLVAIIGSLVLSRSGRNRQ
ncbi:MAG TPA: NADH-quinone oxidoreductase subunit J [Deltaproteobacteria bacterium]|nr:NADH-quinone oxidoreductase subunit J [Deltaproteobacteria bacterium]